MIGETKNKCVECGKEFNCKYKDEDSKCFAEACDTCPDCYVKLQGGWDPLGAADKTFEALSSDAVTDGN